MFQVPKINGRTLEPPEENVLTPSQRLTKALVEKCGSQRKAAKAMKCDPRAIKFWLDGERTPTTENLKKLSASLDGDDWELRERRITFYQRQVKEKGHIEKWL